jgi:Fe2+ transport system protein B
MVAVYFWFTGMHADDGAIGSRMSLVKPFTPWYMEYFLPEIVEQIGAVILKGGVRTLFVGFWRGILVSFESIGGVLVFLPQILILFFFLGLLESTGYMARAAFLMDKLFGWCGLNGKSFVPMLSGYACGIPGIMGARTIEDPKARLATILAVPFMSCGARMPVYVLMCALLGRITSPTTATLVFIGMYFVGILVAVPVSWFYTKYILKSKTAPFVLEMPRYQLPRFRDIGLRVWQSGWEYTRRAGTIIFAMSVIIWALSYFPRNEETEARARTEFVAETAAAQRLAVWWALWPMAPPSSAVPTTVRLLEPTPVAVPAVL